MKILFISEPYIERLLFDFFNQNHIHQFLFLKANHPQMNNSDYSNLLFFSFDEALKKCDCIYILSSHYLPISIVEKCQVYAACEAKQFFCDSIEDEKDNISDSTYIKHILSTISSKKPNILVLQAGKKAQIERVELNICSCLYENGVKYALYSDTWSNKIKDMSKSLGLLCPYGELNEANQLNVVTLKADVADLLNRNLLFDHFMYSVKPDYIVMAYENGYNLQHKLNDVLKTKYSRAIDIFIKSEYVSLTLNDTKDITLFIENIPMVNIFDDVKYKLTFSLGIKELHF